MMRSFLNLYRMEVGFDTSRLLTMTFILPTRKYPTQVARTDMLRRMEERLNAVGAVVGASIASSQPLSGGAALQLGIDGKPAQPGDKPQTVTMVSVGPRYFVAMGVSLIRGRPFEANDGGTGRETAIVNQRLASMYFGQADPIGQRIRLGDDTPGAFKYEWATIVGLAPNIRQRGAQDDPEPDPVVYLTHLQNPVWIGGGGGSVLVRARSLPGALTPLIRKEIFALDPDLSLATVRTMDENLAQQRWLQCGLGTMFGIWAIAIVPAAVGLPLRSRPIR
jgi:hypothetical protein